MHGISNFLIINELYQIPNSDMYLLSKSVLSDSLLSNISVSYRNMKGTNGFQMMVNRVSLGFLKTDFLVVIC